MAATTTSPMQHRWNNSALWRLVWPLMVEQLLAVTIGMADTIMVTSAGEAAVSGIALVDSINILLITIFSSLATGGAVVVSQFLGRKDYKSATLAAKQLVYSIFSVSIVITAGTLLSLRFLLGLIYGNIEADVMQNAEIYFLLSAASYPFLALYNAGAAIFRSMGNSKVSMRISFLVNFVNIAGNAILIYGFGWGVAGAGTSSLVSRMVAAIVILKIGLPNGMESSMFQVGKLMTARIVSTFGTSAIAGNSIAIVFSTFSVLPGAAIGLSMITVVGQCIGAKDYESTKILTHKLLRWMWAFMIAANILIPLLAKPALPLFNLTPEAEALAYKCILIFCLAGIFVWPPSFGLPNALRATGDAKFTMLVSMFSMWVFRIGLSYFFAFTTGAGVVGIWYAMVIDWAVRSFFFIWRWKSEKWKGKKTIS